MSKMGTDGSGVSDDEFENLYGQAAGVVAADLIAKLQDGSGKPPEPPVDRPSGRGDDGAMEARLKALEDANLETRDRLARIETRMDTFATKADLHQELHATTWKFITWTTGIGIALISATMGIVKFMH